MSSVPCVSPNSASIPQATDASSGSPSELSEERRRDLVKVIKEMAEQGRIRVRGARKEAMDDLKSALKESSITQDEFHDLEKEVQSLTDKHVKSIDAHFEAKEKDVMTV